MDKQDLTNTILKYEAGNTFILRVTQPPPYILSSLSRKPVESRNLCHIKERSTVNNTSLDLTYYYFSAFKNTLRMYFYLVLTKFS